MITAGIDPGSVSGAVAVVDNEGIVLLEDLPIVGKMVSAALLSDMLAALPAPVYAALEHVHAMPKQGVSSSFNFGCGFGVILGVLGAMSIPYALVTPTKWKRAMGLDSDGEKSRALAIQLYPSASEQLKRKKDHNKAEALLLAHYYRREMLK